MKKFFVVLILTLILFSSSAFAADAKTLLNSAPLNPTLTGFEPCDKIVKETLSKITNEEMTTYDKVKACYDWLIINCSYGINEEWTNYVTLKNFENYMGPIDATGMLKGHTGVCDDYSCAFAALVRAIGLNCYTISGGTARADGKGMTGHTWTVIKINGTEYIFDPQIDDNIAKGGVIGYYRFCKTYEEMPGSYANYRINKAFLPFEK